MTRHRWARRLTLTAGLGLAIAMSMPVTALQAQQAPPSAAGELVLSQRDTAKIEGQYGVAGSLVTYSAHRTGTDQATLHVEVNGKSLDMTVDFAARTGSWDGHGNILGTEGKMALVAMERALAGRLAPKRSPLGPHEALLYRAVMYWSEAPAGLVLTSDKISSVHQQHGVKDPRAAGPPSGSEEPCIDPVTGDVSILCQQSNEDGIWYIGCSGSWLACYDSASRCFSCAYQTVGKARDCWGRCGGGCCVPDGLGIYTYDCHDHDTCCRLHGGCANPWDSECGDEYWEADDDFLYGQQNCGWQC